METTETSVENLFERVEAYGRTTLDLSKLRLLETTTAIASSLIPRLGVYLSVALGVFIAGIGLALYLGQLLGGSWYGFFIVAACWLLAGIVQHYFFRNRIKKSISDLIIKQALQ